jgi:uncharacterized protein (DUF3820 family)
VKMPFGKHKGQHLEDIPKKYLRWVRKNLDLDSRLGSAIDCAILGKPIPEPESIDTLIDRLTISSEQVLADLQRKGHTAEAITEDIKRQDPPSIR